MSAPDRFIAWCKQEQASLQQQLELLEASKVLTGEDRGSGWVDTATESKKRAQARLAELKSLLTEAGSAMVSKPAKETISPDTTNKPDTTIKKVVAASSPRGEMGQKYLVAGKRLSMRLWINEPGGILKAPTTRDYETVGYVISGSARLDLEGQTLNLKAGDSWLVPAGAMHQYTIMQLFTAIEATAPPAEVHGRDEPA
jgi:quercetin dioxygenase-like cupin family protein